MPVCVCCVCVCVCVCECVECACVYSYPWSTLWSSEANFEARQRVILDDM